jgi:hypothetical protein
MNGGIVVRYVIAVFGALLIGWSAISSPAQAQAMCGERGVVVANLEKTYSEAPVSIGLASNGSVIEVLASPSGTFTIILTQPNGLSCVMAAGENWENLPKRLAGAHT